MPMHMPIGILVTIGVLGVVAAIIRPRRAAKLDPLAAARCE